jgi:CHASE3 domain sensor protein
MYYIILSEIGMGVMMILVYLRYSHFRLSSTNEIKALRKKSDEQSEALRTADARLVEETRTDSQKIQNLLLEIDEMRKDKENEIKLRLSAEKQIELTLQKMRDLESRMNDWKVMQDAVMRDSKDAIIRVGNDLYKKLNENYKQEIETTRNLLGRISKTVTDFSENSSTPEKIAAKTATPKIINQSTPKQEIKISENSSKKFISSLVETMKASGHLVNKDYFLPANFDAHKAKMLLCEVAFVSNDTLHIIDFKACHYLTEFERLKTGDKAAAENDLKQKLDRYFTYLSDPKYRDSISKVMATTKAKFSKVATVIALPSRLEMLNLKEIRYLDKASRFGFEVMDADGLSNIVL